MSASKLAIFPPKNNDRGVNLVPRAFPSHLQGKSPGNEVARGVRCMHFVIKFGEFRIPDFLAFKPDSYEASLFTKFGIINPAARPFLIIKNCFTLSTRLCGINY